MMAPDDAWGLVLKQTRPLADGPQPLAQALGFCLAEAIHADRDLPPANRAAMDGYAVPAAALSPSPVTLRVIGETAAGHPAGPAVRPGACVRIFTGANLPPGADAVVRQEDTEPADDRGESVRLLTAVPPGAHVFQQGENARQGAELLTPGARLNAAALALCAAVGRSVVRVVRRPSVGLLTTGSELLAAAAAAQPHQIRDSNGPFLRAALAEHGYAVAADARVDDDPDRIVAALRDLAACSDVIVLTGGVSVGRYDFTAEAVRRAGATVRFHGVAMKPGKPLLHAVAPAGRLIFGLPGNPLSAMVCFYEFVLPALNLLAGWPAARSRPVATVRLAHDLAVKGERQQHVPAWLSWTPTGPEAAAVAVRGTADVVAAARADGALVVPAGTRAVPAGTYLAFRPWRTPW